MTLPSSIRQVELTPGYPVFEIDHAVAKARVALHGAQLMEWTPAGQKPVIYLSPEAVYHEGKAIRGGIPVCWPWFGHHETDPKLPQHGFVRSRFWELATASEDETGVQMIFATQANEETRQLWPHDFRVELELRIGAELHVALTTMNASDEAFTITGALHSYFTVGDIRQVTIQGLDGAEYLDTVGPKTVRRQTGHVVIDREVDRAYHSADEVRIKDAAWDREISIQGSGGHTRVVWNPWIEKAAALADLPDEDYQRFVCVETAHAWKDVVTVEAGGTHELATTIRLV